MQDSTGDDFSERHEEIAEVVNRERLWESADVQVGIFDLGRTWSRY